MLGGTVTPTDPDGTPWALAVTRYSPAVIGPNWKNPRGFWTRTVATGSFCSSFGSCPTIHSSTRDPTEVFSSVLLGPWASLIILTIVLVVQCLGFADGGLTALGSNIFNMGVIGALGGYSIFYILYTLFRKSQRGFFIALAVSSWLSIVMSAAAAAIELALSGTSPFMIALPAMAGVHAIIGIGEAIITTTAVSLILKTRPDLVGTYVKKGDLREKPA